MPCNSRFATNARDMGGRTIFRRRVVSPQMDLDDLHDALASRLRLTRADISEQKATAGDLPPTENFAAKGEVPLRRFGKTDVLVSALAVGGFGRPHVASEPL